MNINFSKLRLLYTTIAYIAEARDGIVKDLVGYVDDPVRYKRRMRLLIQLAGYEHNLLIKLNGLEIDDPCHYDDHMLRQIKDEISLITDPSS
jgi:hypothetical protein